MREYFIWLAKIITIVFVFVFAVPLFIGMAVGASQAFKGGKEVANNHRVGVVELAGEIVDSKDVVKDLEEFAADDGIDGIVLKIDSPGGAVGPSEEIYSAVLNAKMKKPVIASFGGIAASGGYYAAAGCNKIISQPSTLTGSIGVIMQIPNFRKVAALVGVDMVTIKSGKMKDVGNLFRDMTDDERKYLEHTANTVHENFIKAVATGRSMERAKLLELADGRIFVGSEALALGLVDSLGDVHLAARTVFEVLGKPLPNVGERGSSPALIYPDDSLRDVKKIFGRIQSSITGILTLTGVLNQSQQTQLKFLAP